MKKLWLSGLLAILIIASVGCGQKPEASPQGNDSSSSIQDPVAAAPDTNGGGDNEGQSGITDPATSEELKADITVYFTDEDIMDLKQVQREITYTDANDKYETAFKALQMADEGLISLWDKVELNTLDFSKGQLVIDITIPPEARLGAGGESLAIEALKKTMFQFDEVDSIEVTVDGKQLESLMGHVDLEHPITR
ncbi:GerMN domain-containing protein [Paenibacillus sp. D2_2]|uniref:GerMN domain-containing protein n=1 Tax=Paenibacillus sp. D2_2 TaxID=3073092 RepID=UPI002814F52F|nr:GerMN domain-containing protein [Paenibacillus sp. D2_2]WMT42747.1 GerMN domain-containing protein [Paenibacillus sp. D2_2]